MKHYTVDDVAKRISLRKYQQLKQLFEALCHEGHTPGESATIMYGVGWEASKCYARERRREILLCKQSPPEAIKEGSIVNE